ncbi:hypothetical protein RR48_05920 [Papilio machaon]|uniref:Myb-like domain-containing protein n=1 Tax=Papilio machaon TaxID=76193 RepID=A0A0N1IAG1_PAPMA|nr:hypothetical protein RR48_05920 [Papilio machaon]
MEQIVVKTEVQSNGDILLFYVDENNSQDSGGIGKLEDLGDHEVVEFQESDFVFANVEESVDDYTINNIQTKIQINEEWQEEDVHKLLKLYVDNLENIESGTTTNQQLWEIACRTIFKDKDPTLCEIGLLSLKQKYAEILANYQKTGVLEAWPYNEICHRAFQNDYYVKEFINESANNEEPDKNIKLNEAPKVNEDGVFIINKPGLVRTSKHGSDEKVEHMLNLYLKYKDAYHKKNLYKSIWNKIAMEMGEEDAEYWHKRFLNFKQHYIRMLHRRYEVGPDKINWPYMKIFDQIFDGDERFKNKYAARPTDEINNQKEDKNFNETERTVLVKYCFDCFHEFQDSTIPNKFLWHEIGRLLEKNPELCKEKYREMKSEHFKTLMNGEYDIMNRIPTAIILDNIIARENETELKNPRKNEEYGPWSIGKIDELVQFFFDNMELFKDSVCYYVCWSMVAEKLQKNMHSCKKQWEKLTALYKSILEDKKENPDLQINWKYIDVFDRIFDYGMDINLLEGYENIKIHNEKHEPEKIGVKKVHIDDDNIDEYSEDDELYDERGFMKRSKRRIGESKANRILEYYLKNKEKFSCTLQKKLSLWETLAKQLGITAVQCAHRFRNLKQIYTRYIQREINKPDMPILWPYYAMCKKVFGYRAIKSKLKNGKIGSDDSEEWAAREIKQLINYFANNYDSLHQNLEDHCRWSDLARVIGKTESACSEKFLELRKSYRKLTTMKTRNPEIKVSWKYYNMLDDIYTSKGRNQSINEDSEIFMCDVDEGLDIESIKKELPDDEDFEYIIVIPEDQEIVDSVDEQMLTQESDTNQIEENIESKQINKWNKKTKKQLLINYLKYLRSHKGKEIDSREMWKEISLKLMKPPMSCRRILLKLKNQHRMSAMNEDLIQSPYYKLIEKILKLKPKFAKIGNGKSLDDKKTYKDVAISNEKVEKALKYYLDNLEEFLSPKYEKKYVWMELANTINEPVSKVFNKINYMKNLYNTENLVETEFIELMQEISAKEVLLKDLLITDLKPQNEGSFDELWTDDEIEQLLTWYLTYLDKFKNPKYVRSYLWMDVSEILNKSPLNCSKKMSDIRTEYRNMVKESTQELNDWRFYNLCQKIYGTGKKTSNV